MVTLDKEQCMSNLESLRAKIVELEKQNTEQAKTIENLRTLQSKNVDVIYKAKTNGLGIANDKR